MLWLPPWLELARQEMRAGVREIPGSQHNPRVLIYGRAVTLDVSTDEIPWCSNFMNWLFTQVGIPGTKSAAARSWLRWGIALQHPALGCVAILKRGGGWQPGKHVFDAPGHVMLLVDQPEPGIVTGIGGNQGNRVCEQSFPVERLLDTRWPA